MDARISAKYIAESQTYFGRHAGDVAITVVVVGGALAWMLRNSYSAVMAQAKANWEQNKCNPIYMPFAGVILPIPGQSAATTTIQNFDYCIQKDLSIFFSVLLLPLEYVAFLILTSIDLLIKMSVLFAQFLAWLRSLFSGQAMDMYNKLIAITVPVILIVAKMRDAMARASATLLTSLYVTLTINQMVTSGLLSILTIVLDLLLAMCAVVIAMFVIAIVLMMTPIFPVGVAMFMVATTALLALVIPTIVIYVLLRIFVEETFGKSAVQAPSIPKAPKRKKR